MANVDVSYVNPFIQSAMNVFKTMVFLDIQRGKPFLKVIGEPKADISGTIGLAGQTNGVVAVTFTEDVACLVSSNMLGEAYTEINDMVKDSIGEIANMIAGGAKGIMAEKGLNFKIALPSVIVGRSHNISFPPGVPCMVVPFVIEKINKNFNIEVCLKSS